jgi:7-carboxy-7-deazaguanine synthase
MRPSQPDAFDMCLLRLGGSLAPPTLRSFIAPAGGYTPRVAESLNVNEIYLSLQGESTFAGLPCVFIRLTACNLRCSYCDTAYAFTEGKRRALDEIIAEVERLAGPYEIANRQSPIASSQSPIAGSQSPIAGSQFPTADSQWPIANRLPLVELTGGEPLLQPHSLPLMRRLCDAGFTVLVETSGALDIALVDPRVRRIMDLKCPSSGEAGRNRWENLPHLKATDEVKFVIGTAEDYAWAKEQLARHHLAAVCPVLFSWVAPLQAHQRDASLKPVPAGQTPITRLELVERIIADALPVRFQLQMHKVVWSPDQRGV